MYAQSRPNMGYPVPAQQPPGGHAALPPPPQLQHQDPNAMMQHHMPQHPQHALQPQHQQQPQHHQQLQQALPPVQHQQQQQQAINYTPSGPSGNTDWSGTRDSRTYHLKVEQQPIRARMCGFGDKDRRPITPPPCIRLVVTDTKTGKEIDFNDVDSTFFVLQVDLWHEDASRAVNLVRHSSAAPTVSISSSTVTSYPPAPERTVYMSTPMMAGQWNGIENPRMPSYGGYHAGMPTDAYGASAVRAGYPSYPGQPNYGQGAPPMAMVAPAPPVTQNHTRNLIGMNAVNACRLNDPEGKTGFWFVLQDLSVRTEGTFRLKMSMCDIGTGQPTNACVSSGKCPVLASSFSAPFTVYSAKKFPGVIESTPLSKCFAAQGIKIPIRKDGPKERGNQAEYDADD